MKQIAKRPVWLAALVGLAALSGIQPASAAECKSRAIKVKIVGTFADFPPPAIQADKAWSTKVEMRYGKSYSALLAARDVNKFCRNLRNNKQECTVVAKPCKVVMN